MIEIDGSHGEGGGQLLRMAVALAAVRGRDVRVFNIRAGRANPGLAAQHVAAVRAVAELCAGRVDGLEIGARDVTFHPGPVAGGHHRVDVGTAGSVTLVLQACLPVAFAAEDVVRLEVSGGTDVRWSPPLDYLTRVFVPLLRALGGFVEVETIRRGYYPRGGGLVQATIHPAPEWTPVDRIEPGAVRRVRGVAHASNLPEGIPERMAHAAVRRVRGLDDVKVEARTYRGPEAVGQGGGVVLWLEREQSILGASCLAERGKPSERVGEEAATGLMAEDVSGASVDVHAADQILPYLCLADAPSAFTTREATGHLRSMAWLLPHFFERRIELSPVGDLVRVSVSGTTA